MIITEITTSPRGAHICKALQAWRELRAAKKEHNQAQEHQDPTAIETTKQRLQKAKAAYQKYTPKPTYEQGALL